MCIRDRASPVRCHKAPPRGGTRANPLARAEGATPPAAVREEALLSAEMPRPAARADQTHPRSQARPTPRLQRGVCLLYTSHAAAQRSRVDLGGCRILKKKKKKQCILIHIYNTQIIVH